MKLECRAGDVAPGGVQERSRAECDETHVLAAERVEQLGSRGGGKEIAVRLKCRGQGKLGQKLSWRRCCTVSLGLGKRP